MSAHPVVDYDFRLPILSDKVLRAMNKWKLLMNLDLDYSTFWLT
jgi:hypothetical protein